VILDRCLIELEDWDGCSLLLKIMRSLLINSGWWTVASQSLNDSCSHIISVIAVVIILESVLLS